MKGNHRFLALFTFLAVSLANCATTVSREDLDSASDQIKSGQEDAVEDLYRKREDVPPDDRQRYVEVIGESKSDQASVVLRQLYTDPDYKEQKTTILKELAERPDEVDAAFIRKSLDKDPSLFQPEIEEALLQRKDRSSAETLLAMIEAGRTSLKPASIRLFGETSLQQSLPLLIKHVDEGNDAAVTMQAIARLSTPESGRYIMTTAQNDAHPAHVEAVRQLAAVPDQEEARSLLHSLLGDKHELTLAALEALAGMGFNEESYDKVKQLYVESDDEEVKGSAVQTMATMRQIDPATLTEELSSLVKKEPDDVQPQDQQNQQDDAPTVDTTPRRQPKQTTLRDAFRDPKRLTDIVRADNTQKQPRKTTEKKPPTKKALFKLNESDAASNRYSARIEASLRRTLGGDASAVRLKIHNALLTYATSDSTSAGFVQRSYKKGFGVDDARAKELLKKGLHLQYSLHAVIANVRGEYARKDLQVYALSTFFAIKRTEAEALLNAYAKGRL